MPRSTLLVSLFAALAIACSGSGYSGTAPVADRPLAPVAQNEDASATSLPEPTPVLAARPPLPTASALTPAPWAPAPTSTGASAPALNAAAAAVLDEGSGTLLYGRAAERPLPPASLTKIATAILALEGGSLEATVAIDVDSRKMKSSSVMGLLPGDQFSLRDLLYGLMLPSGNDAALAIGRHLAGSDAAFVDQMNALAERLGLSQTRFANPHGLSARGHVSSAHDLALLARHAMGSAEFREIVGTTARVVTGSRTIELSNVNPFLSYPGADGVKTGYTWRSGRTMLASATRDGHRVYVVLLNTPEMEKDARALMDWAFASFQWST
jgi:D-alanyl-D-alanine carboxypeptidase (penicillin-binding protein 5/6)